MPQLSKNGISVIQGTDFEIDNSGQGHYYVTTTLAHSSGQWMKSKCRLIIGGKKDIQALGGAITYGRRYGLSAMAGIGQFDDDGNTNKLASIAINNVIDTNNPKAIVPPN